MELEKLPEQLAAFFAGLELGPQMLGYGACALSLLALLLALRAARKSGPSEIARLQERLERLDLKLNDLAAEQGRLRDALGRSGVPLPPAQQAAEAAAPKKKSELTVEPGPAPTATGRTFFSGLKKTREHLVARLSAVLRGKQEMDAATFEQLEEVLVTSDMGVRTAHKLLAQLNQAYQARAGQGGTFDPHATLRDGIYAILNDPRPPEIIPQKRDGSPLIVLVVGVNGVGKTTTIGKLADRFRREGARVLVAACDTFRAAAVEQMQAWGRRAGVEVVAGEEGAKPSTVAYNAVHKAKNEQYDVLLVDTAGRLHTRVNLMNELVNVVRLIEREQPGSPHESILVLDASTGQNALQQAREFHERVKLTGIVVTKLDGTPKGGIVVAIKDELGIPIRYIGVGEGVDDLKPFSAESFVDALFADEAQAENEEKSVGRSARRRERAVF